MRRFSAYFLFLPFLPALSPLLDDGHRVEWIIYFLALALTILLVFLSNRKSYIIVRDKNVSFYLIHRHKPEIHFFEDMETVRLKGRKGLLIKNRLHPTLELHLPRKERARLLDLLKERGISINEVYRKK